MPTPTIEASTTPAQEQLALLLGDFRNLLHDVQAVAVRELPDVFQQIISWPIAYALLSWTACIGFAVALGLCVLAIKKYISNTSAPSIDALILLPSMAMLVGFMSSFINALSGTKAAVQAYVAPKLFLLEYLTHAVK